MDYQTGSMPRTNMQRLQNVHVCFILSNPIIDHVMAKTVEVKIPFSLSNRLTNKDYVVLILK